eukprot:2059657-Amphidinium_carterae.1
MRRYPFNGSFVASCAFRKEVTHCESAVSFESGLKSVSRHAQWSSGSSWASWIGLAMAELSRFSSLRGSSYLHTLVVSSARTTEKSLVQGMSHAVQGYPGFGEIGGRPTGSKPEVRRI